MPFVFIAPEILNYLVFHLSILSVPDEGKLFNKHVRLNAGRDSGQLKHIGETPCQYKTT
jgi:hypothetical protein